MIGLKIRTAALSVPLFLAGAAVEGAPKAGPVAPCEAEPWDGKALCGTVQVPEDPEAEGGRRIGLNIVLLRARADGGERRPDPVFILDGGPGQAATRSIEWVVDELSEVLKRRDVVMVDRRGTGKSNPLTCPERGTSPEAIMAPPDPARTRKCREVLAKRADLTKYTTPFAADDLDRVRRALGYEEINLYGGSYGSREAFAYMRRHGGHLRAAAVFAVMPQHRRPLVQSPPSAQRALDLLLSDCLKDDACATAYPDIRRELKKTVERLEKEPATFTAGKPGGEQSGTLTLTRGRWGTLIRSLLISPGGGAQVPYLIHASYQGKWDEIGGLYVRLAHGASSAIARGLFLSAVCAEEMARTNSKEIASAAEGTFWGPSWVQSIHDQCEHWPQGNLPPDWFEPPQGDTPFLFMSGRVDPITPPDWAGELLGRMPNARQVVVTEGHHNFRLDACGKKVLARFYETGDSTDLDTECIAKAERPKFLTR